MQDYNLKPIWEELLKIYKAFADICDRHNLRYYVTDGRALGRQSAEERIISYNIGLGLHDVWFASNIYENICKKCDDSQ